MTSHSLLLHTIVRWLDFLGIALLLGGVAFRHLIAVARPARPARRLLLGALALVSMMSVADLLLRARMMHATMGLSALLPVVVANTHAGHVWLAKIGLLAVLWGLMTSPRAGFGPGPLTRPAYGWRAARLVAAAGFGLTVALSGHAADRGAFTLAVLADWLHVMATTVWVGGLLWLRLFVSRPPDHNDERPPTEVLRRFSRVAATCVVVLVAAGLASAFQQIAAPSALATTPYGRTLVLKVVLVPAMVGLGGLTRFYVLPALTGRSGPISRTVTAMVHAVFGQATGSAILSRARFLIGLEGAIGLIVLICAAVLTQTPPPRAGMSLSPPHIH